MQSLLQAEKKHFEILQAADEHFHVHDLYNSGFVSLCKSKAPKEWIPLDPSSTYLFPISSQKSLFPKLS